MFLQALSKTLTADELFYLKEQFALLEPTKNGTISLDNIKSVSTMQIGISPYLYKARYHISFFSLSFRP